MSKKAFCVGICTGKLQYSCDDAMNVAKILEEHEFICQTITDFGESTKYDFLNRLENQMDDADEFIFYFSGHGTLVDGNDNLHIQIKEKELLNVLYIFDVIKAKAIKDVKCLIILDCCNAMSSFRSIDYNRVDNFKLLCASGTNEEAKEVKKLKSGYLTHFLIKVLENKKHEITNKENQILLSKVYSSISKSMIEASKKDQDTVRLPLLFDTHRTDFTMGAFAQHIDSNVVHDRFIRMEENLVGFSDHNTNFWRVRANYTDIDEVSELQKKIIETLKEQFPRAMSDYPGGLTKYFDAIQRPEIAYINKAFYTFPFFLTPFRLNIWGVIPYAYHRAIGILYHKDGILTETNTSTLQTYISDHEYKPNCKHCEIEKPAHWILQLIDDLQGSNGKLYSISGYMFNELIPLMVWHSRNMKYLRGTFKVGETIHINESVYEDAKQNNKVLPVVKTKKAFL